MSYFEPLYAAVHGYASLIANNGKNATSVLHVAMMLILFFWIRKNGLMKKYGLCKPSVPAKNFLYYIPLAVIESSSLWTGVGLRFTALES